MSLLDLNVPIVGQPAVTDLGFSICIKCTCGQPVMIVGKLLTIGVCQGCHTQYRLEGFPTLSDQGVLSVPLAAARPAPKVGG